jgi:hypothetical protein
MKTQRALVALTVVNLCLLIFVLTSSVRPAIAGTEAPMLRGHGLAREDGPALVLGGESDPTYIQLLSQGATTFVKLSNTDHREQVVRP